MINKVVASVAEALDGVKDGSVVLIGDFDFMGGAPTIAEVTALLP